MPPLPPPARVLSCHARGTPSVARSRRPLAAGDSLSNAMPKGRELVLHPTSSPPLHAMPCPAIHCGSPSPRFVDARNSARSQSKETTVADTNTGSTGSHGQTQTIDGGPLPLDISLRSIKANLPSPKPSQKTPRTLQATWPPAGESEQPSAISIPSMVSVRSPLVPLPTHHGHLARRQEKRRERRSAHNVPKPPQSKGLEPQGKLCTM